MIVDNLIWIISGAALVIIILLIILLLKRNKKQSEISKNQTPITHEKNYKKEPGYPSQLEQHYSSERTYDVEPPVNSEGEQSSQ